MTVSILSRFYIVIVISIALLNEGRAQSTSRYQQVSPMYYQQVTPSYYYSYNPYHYPYYPYYYQQQPQRQLSPAPGAVRKPREGKSKQQTTSARDGGQARDAGNARGWLSDFDSAWSSAVKEGKPLIVLFVHHGCPECDRMNATLAQPGAKQALDSAVKVRVEFTSNPAIVSRYDVKLTPTFLVLSPAHDGEVYREVGALSVERLRQLQPSIESLVSAPADSTSKEKSTSTEKANSNSATADSGKDDETSRSVAAL